MAADNDQASGLGGIEVPFRVGVTDSEIDFRDTVGRERWLQVQPVEVAMVIAARAALRAVPGLSLARGLNRSRLTRRRMILRVFRAVDVAWAVSAIPGRLDALKDAARKALSGMGDLQATPTERSAAYALATLLASTVDVPARASTAIGYALDMAGERGQAAFETMLDAMETDANLLRNQFIPVTIARSQLWRNRPSRLGIRELGGTEASAARRERRLACLVAVVRNPAVWECDPRSARSVSCIDSRRTVAPRAPCLERAHPRPARRRGLFQFVWARGRSSWRCSGYNHSSCDRLAGHGAIGCAG